MSRQQTKISASIFLCNSINCNYWWWGRCPGDVILLLSASASSSCLGPAGLTHFYLGTEGGRSRGQDYNWCVCAHRCAAPRGNPLTCSWLMEMTRPQRAAPAGYCGYTPRSNNQQRHPTDPRLHTAAHPNRWPDISGKNGMLHIINCIWKTSLCIQATTIKFTSERATSLRTDGCFTCFMKGTRSVLT